MSSTQIIVVQRVVSNHKLYAVVAPRCLLYMYAVAPRCLL